MLVESGPMSDTLFASKCSIIFMQKVEVGYPLKMGAALW